jgi:hypothetical protein
MNKNIKIMFIGDVFGRKGRIIVKEKVSEIKHKNNIDFVIANVENAAGGLGITPKLAEELYNSGLDFMTSGNHIWKKKEIYNYLDNNPNKLIRPLNFPEGVPGSGYYIKEIDNIKICIVNLIGRVFINSADCPFRSFERVYNKLKKQSDIIIIDFHGEASSEKLAFAYFMSGKVSAVFGTHTHIQTNDIRIFDNYTAYITDVGMTGPYDDNVIGVQKDIIIKKFLTGLPGKFEPAKKGRTQLNSVILEVDSLTGAAVKLEHFNLIEN